MDNAKLQSFKIGELYFFKDNVIKVENITTNEDLIRDVCRQMPLSCEIDLIGKEEYDIVSIINDNDHKYNDEDIYRKYLDDGYSIIKVANLYNVNNTSCDLADAKKVTCMVSYNINKNVRNNINKTILEIEQEIEKVEKKEIIIENFIIGDLGKNYDKYSGPDKRNHTKSVDALDYFLREKTNELTEDEKVMFKKYREFNLEDLLTIDYKSIYPINNSNSGVIIITEDKTVSSTCKKDQHGLEIIDITNVLHPNLDTKKMNVNERVNATSDICVQIFTGDMIINLPDNMNEYQIDQLNILMDNTRLINDKNIANEKEEILVAGQYVNNLEEKYRSIDEFNELIISLKENRKSNSL